MSDASTAGLSVRIRQATPISLDAAIDCPPGKTLALVGPSGSGKSTILRMIAGLNVPSHGRVACNGDLWLDTAAGVRLAPQERSVGFVFQHYALFPHLTARDNVAAALGHLPKARRSRRAVELLALVHLQGMEERRPGALSGGQQQRVALARALARDPRVLLLDEPFSAVDQVTRRKLQWEVAQLRGALNIPIVLVTHDLEEAAALADVMCILHRGQTLQAGPPMEILNRPASALVARLADLRNVYEGTIESHETERNVTWLRWRGYRLEVRLDEKFEPGQRVSWVVPPAGVILHRRDRPSAGERENPVRGVIGECVMLGETASVTLLVDGQRECRLGFAVPAHVARRNGLEPGGAVGVSLLADSVHLMEWEGPEAP